MKPEDFVNNLRALYGTVKRRGVSRALTISTAHLFDYYYDLFYGTDTMTWVELDGLSINSSNIERAVSYQPSRTIPLKMLFRALQLPRDRVLVDFGCGKGRVLLIASEFGFKEARGVEFSPELCRIAETNCSTYKSKTKTGAHFKIIESDAAEYRIQNDEDVFYFFNPFDSVVLSGILANIVESVNTAYRPVLIIYSNPVHGASFYTRPEFRKMKDFMFWGHEFSVYSNSV